MKEKQNRFKSLLPIKNREKKLYDKRKIDVEWGLLSAAHNLRKWTTITQKKSLKQIHRKNQQIYLYMKHFLIHIKVNKKKMSPKGHF
ncbi:hypothetical protein COJ48_01225 [Bacillus cereus]|nr:hypothetical protein COJ48_01225 [Bacillus cereus]PGP86109.1 hypothetical protein CN997_07360 [Bacillus cereus]